MADEIQITNTMVFRSGAVNATGQSGATLSDSADPNVYQGVQTVTASEVALDTGTVTTPSATFIRNTSLDTNVDIVGAAVPTDPPLVTLQPGEAFTFRFAPGATPAVITGTGPGPTAVIDIIATSLT